MRKRIALGDGGALNAPLRGRSHTDLLNWINILSLDAPVVALVWQDFLAELLHVPLSLATRLVLGLTIWLAYVADRWLDGRALPLGRAVTLRHEFARKHARGIAAAWALVFTGDVILAFIGLSPREFFLGLGLAVLTLGYLAGVHLAPLRRVFGSAKELLVALLFSAGAGVFVLAGLEERFGELVLFVGVFFGVCFVNCLLVSGWERSEDARQAQPSMAIRWNLRPEVLRWVLRVGCVASGVFVLVHLGRALGWLCAATALSFLLLVVLDRMGERIALSQRHVLADAALLTPLLMLPLMPHGF